MDKIKVFNGMSSFISSLNEELKTSAVVINEEFCKLEFKASVEETVESFKFLGLLAEGGKNHDGVKNVIFAREQKYIDSVFNGKGQAIYVTEDK